MKTIGLGLIQIPLVTYFRECFCFKKPLVHCVSGTGWKMFLQNVLRILLLVLWGMPRIDYTYPQTKEKVIGVYIEIGILAIQIADGILTIISSWFKNMYMLYPILVVIPVCFIIDFSVKATCYGQLFLWPQVTTFGVFSLIEVWFRNFTQMYCWIAIISFIYLSRDKKDPFDDEDDPSDLAKKLPSIKSPFSRSSTLSVRGRRSFLLKTKKEKPADDPKTLQNSTSHKSVNDEKTSETQESVEEDDDWSRLLPADTKTPANVEEASSAVSPDAARSLSDNFSFHRHSEVGEKPSKPRYKRVGGFVPEVLRTPSNASDFTCSIATEDVKQEARSSLQTKSKAPPSLPSQPPIGRPTSRGPWKYFSHKDKKLKSPPSFRQDQSFLV